MPYLIFALGFLILVVGVLRTLRKPEPLYITITFLLLITLVVGFIALTGVVPLWEKNTGIAVIIGFVGLAYSSVACWGFIALKRHFFGSRSLF